MGGIARFPPCSSRGFRSPQAAGARLIACRQALPPKVPRLITWDVVERALAQHHHQLTALVIEPLVQCACGHVCHPPGYLRGIAQLCRRFNVLFIADEVAVGFGRTGTMFACQQERSHA